MPAIMSAAPWEKGRRLLDTAPAEKIRRGGRKAHAL
jgi:hypothetical protein